MKNRQIVLRRRPHGMVTDDDVEMIETEVPDLGDGEVLVRNVWLAMDATVRSWLDEGKGYLPAVEIGEVVRCSNMGRVIASNHERFPVGAWHAGLGGWQDYAVIDGGDEMINNPHPPDADGLRYVSVLSSPAPTAYFGLTEAGKVEAGETVLVSAAAGATGSAVVQIARILGCSVIGIAGNDEKCRWVEELGAEACINRRTEDVNARLKELRPRGIDVYFDNVGGEILDTALRRIAHGGRVVVSGAISMYNADHRPPGPSNYLTLINRQASMVGFLGLAYVPRYPEVWEMANRWIDEGRFVWHADVRQGLDQCVAALNALYTGENRGKSVVQVCPDPGPTR